jgi:DNA polymerase-1
VTKDGYEADDILASLAAQIAGRIVILTNDSDALACVTERVTVYRPKKIRETHEWGVNEVVQHYGIPPWHLSLYKALVGEPGDHIKGIDGIGPRTALKLIREGIPPQYFAHIKHTLPLTTLVHDICIPEIEQERW